MRRWLSVSVPFVCAAALAFAFLRFFDLADTQDLAVSALLVLVTGLLTVWSFGGLAGGSPTWEEIGRWVGRGIARVSYVALFGIPVVSSIYSAAETAPPPVFLMGYLSSFFYAIATTTYILRERFPRPLDGCARWTGTLSIHLGFFSLALLFQIQSADVLEAYAKPRRALSLEPARRALREFNTQVRETREQIDAALDHWRVMDEEFVTTCASIRQASETLDEQVRRLGPASEDVQTAAKSVHDLAEKGASNLATIEKEREKLRDRLRFFTR
ncbi:MAG: hypothetical protein HYZ53_18125 [Planctomycetes bacterium]|nr:hypothetical protein [Planctomycetota bacterium]